MKKILTKSTLIKGCSGIFLFVFLITNPGFAKDSVKLPKTMQWSCYDVGTTGYIHASLMAGALLKKYGVKVRLIPSGTSVGRLMLLASKRVQVGWLATGAHFAAEGVYDFAEPEWGPQDLRVFLAHPTSHAVAVTRASGIKKIANLKGKRVAWIPGNPSLNVKMTAYLAFGNLTWNDVQRIDFANYGAAMRGMIANKVDAVMGTTTSSFNYELESTPKGIYYPPFPAADKEGWKRMLKIAPFLKPYKEGIGAGISKDHPVELVQYRFPIGTVYADADPDFVYNLVKALDESYSLYEKGHPTMPWWKIDKAGVPPCDAPFHEGAIRYLKEKGIWTKEHQQWNDAMVKRMKKLQALWKKVVDMGHEKKMKTKDIKKLWMSERAKANE